MKRFIFVRRREDFTREAFSRYWRETHAPIILGIPDFQKYTKSYAQNHFSAPAWRTPFPYDGIAEITPGDGAGGAGISQTPYYRDRVVPDEAAFIDRDNSLRLQADQRVVRERRGDGIKIIALAAHAGEPGPREDPPRWSADDRRSLDAVLDRHGIVGCTLHDIRDGSMGTMSGSPAIAGDKFSGLLELWIDAAALEAGAVSAARVLDELLAGRMGVLFPGVVAAYVADEVRFG